MTLCLDVVGLVIDPSVKHHKARVKLTLYQAYDIGDGAEICLAAYHER